MRIFLILVVGLCMSWLLGCTTTPEKLSFKTLNPEHRIYIGRFIVHMNDIPPDELNCEVYLNRDLAPFIKLESGGHIQFKSNRSEIKFTRIACLHHFDNRYSAWHHARLDFENFYRTQSRKEVVDFGDVHIHWKIDEKETVRAARLQPRGTGIKQVGVVKDSGELKVHVSEKILPNSVYFFKLHPEATEKGMEVRFYPLTVKESI